MSIILQVVSEDAPIRMKLKVVLVVAADQTEPEEVVVEAVATLGVPVVADLTPVGVVVDRITMARSSLTRLVLIMALVTSSSSFLTSDK